MRWPGAKPETRSLGEVGQDASPREFRDRERSPGRSSDVLSSIAREWDLKCLVTDDRTYSRWPLRRNGCAIAIQQGRVLPVPQGWNGEPFESIFSHPLTYKRQSCLKCVSTVIDLISIASMRIVSVLIFDNGVICKMRGVFVTVWTRDSLLVR